MKPGDEDAAPATEDAQGTEVPGGEAGAVGDGPAAGAAATGDEAAIGDDVPAADEAASDVLAEDLPVPTAGELSPDETSPPTDLGFPMIPIGAGLALLLILAVIGKTLFGPSARPALEAEPSPVPAAPETEDEIPADHTDEVGAPPESLVSRFSRALGRSRAALQERFDVLFGRDSVDESLFEELEEVLLTADVGLPTTNKLLAPLRELAANEAELPELREALRTNIEAMLLERDPALAPAPLEGPWVLLVVGVNGSGKTTTIGKLAARFRTEGKQVLLAAADTYRAAAADQLKVWAERAGVDIVAHDEGSDPGAVVYDALDAAAARGKDVVIVDTAGRLQTARPLMEQLGKIRRVIDKKVPGGPHETLLVLDGTMGQNGLSQARLFDEATPLTGAVVTKLDGTAKGGMVLTLSSELGLPVKFIGIGEAIEDLKPFDAKAFAEALA